MISRDRVIRTLNHQSIDRAPRDLWLLPGVETCRPDDVAEINARFPADVLHLYPKWSGGGRGKGPSSKADTHTDAWGCTWQLGDQGVLAALAVSPLASGTAMAQYVPPAELLDPARFARVNPTCADTGRFTLAGSQAHPLDRLRQLRGSETALRELCDNNGELRGLLDKLHAFFRKEIDVWAKTLVDGVVFGDDLSCVAASRTHLKLWRSLFKPLYREYCTAIHAHDKFAFFLCEGALGEALDDLVEIGIDAVHAQWRDEEFEKQVARHRKRVTFWGGVEQRRIEPPGHCGDIQKAVLRVRKALDYGAGGVISQIAWSHPLPLRNIVTFFEQWLVPLPVTV
jgi:hypothetical protein